MIITKKTSQKISRVIASILVIVMFASSNGSFLVWGMSEGRLGFLGEPKVAQAKIIETAEAITVDEIIAESRGGDKSKNSENKRSIFSDSKTEIVAREVLGDKAVDVLNEDVNDLHSNLKTNINNQRKNPGFFKKLWANFVGIFNKDLKTSILEEVNPAEKELIKSLQGAEMSREVDISQAQIAGNLNFLQQKRFEIENSLDRIRQGGIKVSSGYDSRVEEQRLIKELNGINSRISRIYQEGRMRGSSLEKVQNETFKINSEDEKTAGSGYSVDWSDASTAIGRGNLCVEVTQNQYDVITTEFSSAKPVKLKSGEIMLEDKSGDVIGFVSESGKLIHKGDSEFEIKRAIASREGKVTTAFGKNAKKKLGWLGRLFSKDIELIITNPNDEKTEEELIWDEIRAEIEAEKQSGDISSVNQRENTQALIANSSFVDLSGRLIQLASTESWNVQNGVVYDQLGRIKAVSSAKYAEFKKDEMVTNLSNSTQQAAKLRAIEEKKGWLAKLGSAINPLNWFGSEEESNERVVALDSSYGSDLVEKNITTNKGNDSEQVLYKMLPSGVGSDLAANVGKMLQSSSGSILLTDAELQKLDKEALIIAKNKIEDYYQKNGLEFTEYMYEAEGIDFEHQNARNKLVQQYKDDKFTIIGEEYLIDIREGVTDRVKSDGYLKQLTREFDGDVQGAKEMQIKRINEIESTPIQFTDDIMSIAGLGIPVEHSAYYQLNTKEIFIEPKGIEIAATIEFLEEFVAKNGAIAGENEDVLEQFERDNSNAYRQALEKVLKSAIEHEINHAETAGFEYIPQKTTDDIKNKYTKSLEEFSDERGVGFFSGLFESSESKQKRGFEDAKSHHYYTLAPEFMRRQRSAEQDAEKYCGKQIYGDITQSQVGCLRSMYDNKQERYKLEDDTREFFDIVKPGMEKDAMNNIADTKQYGINDGNQELIASNGEFAEDGLYYPTGYAGSPFVTDSQNNNLSNSTQQVAKLRAIEEEKGWLVKFGSAINPLNWFGSEEESDKKVYSSIAENYSRDDNTGFYDHSATFDIYTVEDIGKAEVFGEFDGGKPTMVYIHGFSDEAVTYVDQTAVIDSEDSNVVTIRVDYKNPLNENTQFVIDALKQLKNNGANIDKLVAHSAGNRLAFEALHTLGREGNTLLAGTNFEGINPKIFDEEAEGNSTGVTGLLVDLFSSYGNTTDMMDPKHPQNIWLTSSSEVDYISDALKDEVGDNNGSVNLVVAIDDPHIPTEGQSGELFKGILENIVGTDGNKVIKINTGNSDTAHTGLLGSLATLDETGDLLSVSYKTGFSTIYRLDEDSIYKPVELGPITVEEVAEKDAIQANKTVAWSMARGLESQEGDDLAEKDTEYEKLVDKYGREDMLSDYSDEELDQLNRTYQGLDLENVDDSLLVASNSRDGGVKTSPFGFDYVLEAAKTATDTVAEFTNSFWGKTVTNIPVVRDTLSTISSIGSGLGIINQFSGSQSGDRNVNKKVVISAPSVEDAAKLLDGKIKDYKKYINPDGSVVYFNEEGEAVVSLQKGDNSGEIIFTDLKKKQSQSGTENSLNTGTVITLASQLGLVSGPVVPTVVTAYELWDKWNKLPDSEKREFAGQVNKSVEEITKSFEDFSDQFNEAGDQAISYIKKAGETIEVFLPSGEVGKFESLGDGYFRPVDPTKKYEAIYKIDSESGKFIPVVLPNEVKEKIITDVEVIQNAKEDVWSDGMMSFYYENLDKDDRRYTLYSEIYQQEKEKYQKVDDELDNLLENNPDLFGDISVDTQITETVASVPQEATWWNPFTWFGQPVEEEDMPLNVLPVGDIDQGNIPTLSDQKKIQPESVESEAFYNKDLAEQITSGQTVDAYGNRIPGLLEQQIDVNTQGANAPPEISDQGILDLEFDTTKFIERGIASGVESGAREVIGLIAVGQGTPEEAVEVMARHIIDQASMEASTQLFGTENAKGEKELGWLGSGLTEAAIGMATAFAVGDEDQLVDVAAGVAINAGWDLLQENNLLGTSVQGALKGYVGDGIKKAAETALRTGDIEQSASIMVSTVGTGYVQEVIRNNADLWSGDIDSMGAGQTSLVTSGLSTGVASGISQLVLTGELDIETLGKDVAQSVVATQVTNMVAEAIGNSVAQNIVAAGLSEGFGNIAVNIAAEQAGEQAATSAAGSYGWMVGAAVAAGRLLLEGELDTASVVSTVASIGATMIANSVIASLATTAVTAGGTAATGAAAGSVVPGLGTVIGAVVGIVVGLLMSDTPKEYEIEDWKASALEAINPNLAVNGISGAVTNQITAVAASGDTARAKEMMRDAVNSTALGKIVNVTGLGGLFDSALALMNNRIERLNDSYINERGGPSTEDHIDTGDAELDSLTNKYIHLKNKLKHCYSIGDNDCVSEVSQDIRAARNGLLVVATNKFNAEIADLNKEIHSLEAQLSQAKSAKERAILEAQLAAVRSERDNIRGARDQYQEIARSCPSGTQWHHADHYCIDISKNKAHCEGGGGTWHGSSVTGSTGCTCDAASGGHWMGDHCEYGFSEVQLEQNKIKDGADECGHRQGNWRWDGSACVETSQAQSAEVACSKKGSNWTWKNGHCSYEGGGEN